MFCSMRFAGRFVSMEKHTDLPKLEHTNVLMQPADIAAALERAGEEPEKEVRNNLEAMRLISELEQGKQSLRMDKVNQVLRLFDSEVGAVPTKKENENKVKINSVFFKSGVYLVEVETSQGKQTKKILK